MIGHNQPPAAISGSYADFKLVKTREVCQIVIEVPLEQGVAVVDAFGLPQFGAPVRLAVARVWPDGQEEAPQVEQPKAEKERRRFEDMPASQQAGMLCADTGFQRWLYETKRHYAGPSLEAGGGDDDWTEWAAEYVRRFCKITSRRDLDTSATSCAATAWQALVRQYRIDTGKEPWRP